MRSPLQIPFMVVSCVPHNDTHVEVRGKILPDYIKRLANSMHPPQPALLYKQYSIIKGFLFPDIGWEVLSVPGLTPQPELEYHCQVVPPPLNAWFDTEASDLNLIFNNP